MDRLNETDAAFEASLELLCESWVGSAMKLDGCKARLLHDVCNLVCILCVEDTDTLYRLREMWHNSRNLSCGYLPLARSKDETDGICTQFGSKMCVIEIRVGADLNPHR